MKYKLIIFDMDGVLVDSEPAISTASKEALSEWCVEASIEDFKEFTGMGDDRFIGGVAAKYGVEYDIAMKARAYEIYLSTAKERVGVYPWSKSVISEMHEKGYMLAVASASDKVKVECNIECIGVDKSLFRTIVTGSDVKNKKPAPDIFLCAAEKAGFLPEESVVVEDALSGVMAAKAAKMTAVAVTTSFTYEALKNAGADYIVSTLDELAGIVSENA